MKWFEESRGPIRYADVETSVSRTGCPRDRRIHKGEQGRFVTPMSRHQARDTGFLARRVLG